MEATENRLKRINLSPEHLDEIKSLIEKYNPETEVWAYGSRVKFTNNRYSDLDLVAIPKPNEDLDLLDLKVAFVESKLPFCVDLHNWSKIPKSFHNHIKENYYILHSGR